MIDAQGMAAMDRKIRFGSILLLCLAGGGLSFLTLVLSAVFHVPAGARILAAAAVQSLSWIWGYQLLGYDRDWISLRARFSAVQTKILWASAAGPVVPILIFLAAAKILMWCGVKLSPLPTPDFLLGGLRWLPATLLIVAIIAPAAEELMVRGLLLDWLRQKMAVWPAILISALIFGLLHGVALHSGASGWLQFAYRVVLGIVAAYLAVRYRSLRPSFVLHATNNCLVVVASAFST